MSRKKVGVLIFLVICLIGGVITIYKMNEPKNVFEEIYVAEMSAAEQHQNTPLSNTEYFHEAVAVSTDYTGNEFTNLDVKETPKESSPYKLSVAYLTDWGPKSPVWGGNDLIKKSVKIESVFLYHNVEVEIEYQYILYNGRVFERFTDKEGLYISVRGAIPDRKLIGFQDFYTYYGIPEDELGAQVEQNINHILNYWVDNYPESKFKRDDFGTYEIIEN